MESKMNLVITMAGLGTRFRRAGYECPKYMIKVKDKTLFEWSMDSLIDYNPHVSKYIFVVRREDQASDFIRNKISEYGIRKVEVVEIDNMTDGQATTCMLAIPFCTYENPILVYNIDTYVEAGTLRYRDISGDGHIPCFHADGDHWSFVRLDRAGNVVEVREKVRISDNCTLGAYYFSSAKLYEELYQEFYADSKNIERNEKYIAPLYNLMIGKGMTVSVSLVDAKKVHVLGTPEELAAFERSI